MIKKPRVFRCGVRSFHSIIAESLACYECANHVILSSSGQHDWHHLADDVSVQLSDKWAGGHSILMTIACHRMTDNPGRSMKRPSN